MKDRIPTYPGRVKLTPVDGQANTFDMVRADDPVQEGTPLNKATLLTDEIATLFGLGEDSTVNDVFGQFGKHWWKRRAKNVETVLGSVEQVGAVKLNGSISYSDSVIVNTETGTVSLSEPILSMTLSSAGAASALAGKYIAPTLSDLSGKIFFVESSAGFASGNYIYLNIQQVTASVVEGETEYVSSLNRNEYPDSGYVEGYDYAYLGVPFCNARNGGAKIETGSYVGAGTYGANNPCTLTFGFEPKLLLVSSDAFSLYPNSGYWKNGTLWMHGTTAAYTTASSTSVNFSLNGNTLSWYGNNSAAAQLNTSGTTYHYIAIG